MISPIVKQKDSVASLIKVFDANIWILLIGSIFIQSILTTIMRYKTRANLMNDFLSSLWIFLQPLCAKGDRRILYAINYLFWLISLIPFLEIYRNDLLSKLVSSPVRTANSVDDLLSSEYQTAVLSAEIKFFVENESKLKYENMQKFIQLNSKTERINLLKITDKITYKWLKHSSQHLVLLAEEEKMKVIYGFLIKFFQVRIGTNSYVPRLLSPICFKPHFRHVQVADKM